MFVRFKRESMAKKKLRLVPSQSQPAKQVPLPELPSAGAMAEIVRMHCGRAPPAHLLEGGGTRLRERMISWRNYFDRIPANPDPAKWAATRQELGENATPAQVALTYMAKERVRPPPTKPLQNQLTKELDIFARRARVAAAAMSPLYLLAFDDWLARQRKGGDAWLFAELPPRPQAWAVVAHAMRSDLIGAFDEAGITPPPSDRNLSEAITALLEYLVADPPSASRVRNVMAYQPTRNRRANDSEEMC
jgi:hypothetical protein